MMENRKKERLVRAPQYVGNEESGSAKAYQHQPDDHSDPKKEYFALILRLGSGDPHNVMQSAHDLEEILHICRPEAFAIQVKDSTVPPV